MEAVGILSLAIQSGERGLKAYEFVEKYKEAQSLLASFSHYLACTSGVLENLKQRSQKVLAGEDLQLVEDVLKECEKTVGYLNALLEKRTVQDKDGKLKRMLKSTKAVFDEEKIRQCVVRLGHLEQTLMLSPVYQNEQRYHNEVILVKEQVEDVAQAQADIQADMSDVKALLQKSLEQRETQSASDAKPILSFTSTLQVATATNTILQKPGGHTEHISVMSEKPTDNVYSSPTVGKCHPPARQRSRPTVTRSVVERYTGSYPALLANIHYQSEMIQIRTLKEDEEEEDQDEDAIADLDLTVRHEIKTSYTVVPRRWLWNKGISMSCIRAGQSWLPGLNLRSFYTCPDDALIFKFCSKGNVDAVRTLLDTGKASPFDVDEDGWTPLHCAALTHNAAICKLLIHKGADPNVLDFHNVSPLHLALSRPPGSLEFTGRRPKLASAASCGDVPRVVRYLVGTAGADPALETAEGENCFDLLRSRALSWPSHLLFWMLRTTKHDPDPNHRSPNGLTAFMSPHFVLMAAQADLDELFYFQANINARIERIEDQELPYEAGWTLLHIAIAQVLREEDGKDEFAHLRKERVRYLVAQGADCHALSDRGETPTDVALRFPSSYRFDRWREVLLEMGFDLREFARREIAAHVEISWYAMNWCDYYLIALLGLDDAPEDDLMTVNTWGPFAARDDQPTPGEALAQIQLAEGSKEEASDEEDDFWDFLDEPDLEPVDLTAAERRRQRRAELKKGRLRLPGLWYHMIICGAFDRWNDSHERSEWVLYGRGS